MEANRGKLFSLQEGRQAYHPSFILHTPDKATKQLRYEKLVIDLQLATEVVRHLQTI